MITFPVIVAPSLQVRCRGHGQLTFQWRCWQNVRGRARYWQWKHTQIIDSYKVFQSPYWSVLASDASSQIVNMSSDASGASINVAADEAASPLATQTWALIDTTQHLSGQGTDVPRVDAARWSDLAGINSDSYAVRSNNVWLSDRQTNRNRTHNFFAHGPTRPDLVLQDLISIIKPEFQANYQPTFLRRADRPDDFEAQRRTASSCTAPDAAVSSLQVGSCSLPAWAKGYHSSGVSNNAYGRDEEVESLALTSGRSDTLNGGEIAGVVIGIVADVALVGAAVVLVRRRKQKKRQEVQEVKGPVKEVDGGSLSSGGMA
ncbi:hypothetical protein KVT40_006041 [Elsinoe batatas]|uniref:Uncharacterized protein n=1 Tax=Elsinoe batatas TaxID=2601811 RepID=A0A8K0KYJ5_9PEZI|nr:hypothetical protein KVT40_006041 [Elsinoe batatas]